MTLDENYHLHDMHCESVNIQYLKYFHSVVVHHNQICEAIVAKTKFGEW